MPRVCSASNSRPSATSVRLNAHRTVKCTFEALNYHGFVADKEKIKEEVVEVLKTVNDPELGIDIWNLGLVYEIDVDDSGDVKIDFTLTTMGCPIGPMIEDEIKAGTNEIEGIGEVTCEMV